VSHVATARHLCGVAKYRKPVGREIDISVLQVGDRVMMENSTIKKMVSGILSGRKNASFDRHIMHPEREWFVVVFIGFVLFAFGISWNVSTHLQFKNVAISSTPEVEQPVVYRAGLVESALNDFEVRKREYEQLKQSLLMRQVAVPIVPDATESAAEAVVTPESDAATESSEPSVVDGNSSTQTEEEEDIAEFDIRELQLDQ
jgi:hypothetical protein